MLYLSRFVVGSSGRRLVSLIIKPAIHLAIL